jgi:hypothetical protein
VPKFIKVLPRDYERMLNAFKKVEEQGLTGDEAAMAAFEETSRTRPAWAATDPQPRATTQHSSTQTQ